MSKKSRGKEEIQAWADSFDQKVKPGVFLSEVRPRKSERVLAGYKEKNLEGLLWQISPVCWGRPSIPTRLFFAHLFSLSPPVSESPTNHSIRENKSTSLPKRSKFIALLFYLFLDWIFSLSWTHKGWSSVAHSLTHSHSRAVMYVCWAPKLKRRSLAKVPTDQRTWIEARIGFNVLWSDSQLPETNESPHSSLKTPSAAKKVMIILLGAQVLRLGVAQSSLARSVGWSVFIVIRLLAEGFPRRRP